MSSFGIPGLFDGWDLVRFIIAKWTVWTPIALWRKLGDAEYVERLDPRLQKAYGLKLRTGVNGKIYVEPPPPLKRLQISLLFGLLTAAVLAGFLSFIVHTIFE